MNRKHQHDGHVIEWRTSPIGKCLRKFNSERLHDAHAKLFNCSIKAALTRNTRWTRDADGKEQCLVWTGHVKKHRNTPLINLFGGNTVNAVTHYQRIYADVHLPHGWHWSPASCGNDACIRHRAPITLSEARKLTMPEVASRPSFIAKAKVNGRSCSKFTEEQIAAMKPQIAELRANGVSFKRIGECFGMSTSCAFDLHKGNRWADAGKPRTGISFIASQLLGAQA